ncbi:MAG: glycosyltransferase family 39 protein [Gammaproteobacteria bacterium]
MISNSSRLILGLIAIYCLGIFDHHLWSPLDTRGAGIIWGMLHSGDWAVPVLNGNPFLEKPPLMHWTSLLLITITGIVNEGMMRLPSAIYGFGAVLVTYLWGRREHNERTGLCAAFLCTGSLLYFEYAKTTFTDATLVFFVILSMYLFWRAFSTDRFRYRNYLPFIFVSALAFFAKGLIGVAFVWVPIEAYLAYRREWRLFFLLPVFYLPVFSVLVGYWAWKLWSVGGLEYLRIVFVDNQIGRFFTFTDTSLPRDPYFFHKEPIYYYLLDSPLRMLPWVFLLPGALYYYFRPGKRAGSEFELYLKFALVCMLLILHASSAKVSTYMLPVYPVLFYLAAVWMDRELGNWRWTGGQWMIVLGGLCAGILALIPTGLVIGLYLAPQSFFDRYLQGYDAMQAVSDNLALACFLASLVVAGLTVYAMAKALARLRAGHGVELTAAFPGTITLLFAIGAALLVQIYDPQRSFKPVADEALTEMNNGYRIALGTHDELATGGFSFYLDRVLPVYTDPQAAMDFLDGKKAILILQKKDRGRLHALIDSGKYSVTEMAGQGHVSRSFIFVRNDPA